MSMSQTKALSEPLGSTARVGVAAADPAQAGYGKIHAIPVTADHHKSGGLIEAVYSAFEVVAALLVLIVASPLILAVALLIRLDSPGPIFFFHKRPARSLRKRGRDLLARADLYPPPGGFDPDAEYYVPNYFYLIKFRSMYSDARTRFPEYFHSEYARQDFRKTYSHIQNDPRITKVGRILRKLSVDELPNLWSVVCGDLRLVGPRPEAPEVVHYYTPEEMLKFTCKPGITGLAQVSGRGLLNWGDTLALDLEYVRRRSVALDVKIIFLTIKRVITRHGAL